MNMTSSDEAFSLFDKWKDDGRFILLHSYTHGQRNRFAAIVVDVLKHSGIVLLRVKASDMSESELSVDLQGATFEYADPRESPDPELAETIWDCFLVVFLPSGGSLIFAARTL